MRQEAELEYLAIFVHGSLASLHTLGFIYNVRRRHWFQAALHAGVALYDFWASAEHVRASRQVAS
jgi:hypothetical protein